MVRSWWKLQHSAEIKSRYTSLLLLLSSLLLLPLPAYETNLQETSDAYLLGIYYVPDTVLALRMQRRIKHRFGPKWLQSMKVFGWW